MAAFDPVTHVIFDLDGTLLDTESLYMKADAKMCCRYGKKYTKDIRIHTAGFFALDACEYIVSQLGLPITAEEYYNEAKELYRALFPSAKLLPDTEGIYFNVQSSIINEFGHDYSSELRQKILGTIENETARIFIEELGLPLTIQDFMRIQTERLQSEMPSCILMPGAEQLIRHMHAHGVPIAVATSSSNEHIKIKMTNHGELFSLMHHIVSGTSDPEVKAGKPAPDIFLVCASRFPDNPPPSNVLVFEDAPNGVIAARTAGMQCVMVPEDYISEDKRAAATLVLKSLEDFQPELFGLPPF